MTLQPSIYKFIFRVSTIISFGFILTACEKGPPPFLWDPNSHEASVLTEEEEKTYRSIDNWLKQAPFDELWDPFANKEDGTVIRTNTDAVFPFANKWYNAFGKANRFSAFRTTSRAFYADPAWSGTVLTWAGIKKQKMPFYLEEYNSEAVNPLTPGYNSFTQRAPGFESSSVKFYTTKTFSETKEERQAVLWGFRKADDSFLTGFLERGNLLFLVAFPCNNSQINACTDKLGEVSRSLSLNVSAWENLSAEGLEKEEHDFFFNVRQHNLFEQHDVFKKHGVFKQKIKVTMNGHPFKRENKSSQKDKVIFSYEKPVGNVRVTVHQPEKISAEKLGNDTAEEYLKDLYSGKPSYRIDYNAVFNGLDNSPGRNAYFEETIKKKVHSITAHSFLSDKHLIKIEYEFPLGDEDARLTAERFITMIDLPYLYY